MPGTRLGLRIFEKRYLDMIRSCLKSDSVFGVIAISSGSEVGEAQCYAVGTTARIVDWTTEPDGLLGIAVAGEERFKVDQMGRNADGLYVGRVEWIPDDETSNCDDELEWALRLLKELTGQSAAVDQDTESGVPDAAAVSWRLADLMPFAVSDKQALLETAATSNRLELLRELTTEVHESQREQGST